MSGGLNISIGQIARLQKLKLELPDNVTPGNMLTFGVGAKVVDLGYTPEQYTAAVVSQAATGLTQLGTWSASTNLTDTGAALPAVPTGNIGEYYDVTQAGTRFGITWAVNDKIIIAKKPDGTLLWTKQATTGDIFDPANVYISPTGTPAQSGTILRPKRQLSEALAVVAQPGTITASAGVYGLAGQSLSVTKQNITLIGRGSNSSNQAEYVGSFIDLMAARFRIRDFNINASVRWQDTTGGHQLQNVAGLSGFVFQGMATARGFAIISDCELTSTANANNIILQNLSSGTATLYLTRVTSVRMTVGTGWTVVVTDCKDMMITSNTGTVIHTDDLPVIAFLGDQAALDAAIANIGTASFGQYILGFNGATGSGVAGAAKGDMLYKVAPTAMGLAKKYAWAPAVIYGPSGKSWYKSSDGYWAEIGSGGGGSASLYESGVLDTLTHGSTTFSTTWVDVPGGVFQIPSAGIWNVEYSCAVSNANANATAFRLIRVTDSEVVDGSMAAEGYVPGSTATHTTVQKSFPVSVAGANTAYKLQWCVSASTSTLLNNYTNQTGIQSASVPNVGESFIRFEKRSGFTPMLPVLTFTEPLTIGAITTAPTKGPRNLDYISLTDDGSGWCTVSGALNTTGAGVAGNGTYLFSLPSGFSGEFDQTVHPLNSQTVTMSGSTTTHQIIPGSNGFLYGPALGSSSLVVVPHGPRSFKLMSYIVQSGAANGVSTWDFLASNYFALNGARTYHFSFRFKKA